MDKFTTCLNILHSFHHVVSLTLSFRMICRMLFPPRNLPFYRLDELLQDPSTTFVLPSYIKTQTWALASLLSLPSWTISHRYDPMILDLEVISMMKH
jgi:hypothetical protein